MQLKMEKHLNVNSLKQILTIENKFISELLSKLPIRQSIIDDKQDEVKTKKTKHNKLFSVSNTKRPAGFSAGRATSLEELQNRLSIMRGQKNLRYKEKIIKKGLKNKLKKKSKNEHRAGKSKLIKMQKAGMIKRDKEEENISSKPPKPVFNAESKIVFSKFDFSVGGVENKSNGGEKNPRRLLENLDRQKDKMKKLQEAGDTEKAVALKEKIAWKSVLAKAEGKKIKDDSTLLKKTINRRDQIKRTSAKKWAVRNETVKKNIEERQQKRESNINKRKKDNKTTKLKKAVKRGRVIPGF